MNLRFVNPLHWKKSTLFTLLALCVLIWFTFIDTYSFKTRWELHSQKKELIKKTADLEAGAEELKGKIEQLEQDEALLEKIAREEYGMRKNGETVYKVKRGD